MLVGDILLSAREAVPDLPGVIPNPGTADMAVTAVSSANPLPAGTLYYQLTYTNQWGETSPCAEQTVVIGAGQALQVSVAASPVLGVFTGVNLYTGVASGQELRQYSLALNATNTTADVDSTTAYQFSPPPQGNGAFLPDSCGSVASAAQIYRWFQDALNMIATANGGVPDTCGFASVTGEAIYTLQGDWKSLDSAWYDGYPIKLGSARLVYRHNQITSLVGMMNYTQVVDKLVCECFPQPNRDGGQTTLSAGITAAATTANTPGLTGFVLPLGLVMFGAGNNVEYASFTSSGNDLFGMVRGLGGTNAQAWPTNTPVTEMNIMFAGWRAPNLYNVGSATTSIRLPSDWIPLLHKYILSRYRKIEQQYQESVALEKEFMEGMKNATKRKAPIGERQINPQDEVAVDIYPGLSRLFGGVIIP